MHGAAQAFSRAMAIGVAKSVSFKKTKSVIFKISFQKVLKLKKSTDLGGAPLGVAAGPRN